MRRARAIRAVTFTILATWAAVALAERDLGPEFHQLTAEVVTPHFDWAPRYERGPLRVFSIGQAEHQRDAIELAQRFHVQVTHLNTLRFGFGYPPGRTITDVRGTSEADRLKRFRAEIAKSLDVIVPDGQFLFEVFPDEVTYTILDKVRRGAGLVIFTHYRRTGDGAPVPVLKRRPEIDRILYQRGRAVPVRDHFLSAGVPFRGLGPWSKIPDQQAFESKMVRRELGKGRILILTELYPGAGSRKPGRFTAPNPFDGDYVEPWEHEYYYAFAMKALLWAARKEPSLLVEAFRLRDPAGRVVTQVCTDTVGTSSVALVLKGVAPSGTVVNWFVRARRGECLHSAERPVVKGRSILTLPALGRGRYYVDAVVRRGDTTINWGTTIVAVTGTLVLKQVTPDAPSLAPGQDLTVRVALSDAAPGGTRVRCRAVGNYDRLLARQVVGLPVGQTVATWRYRHTDRVGRLVRVTVELVRDRRVLDTHELEIPVRLPIVYDAFQTMMWGRITDELPRYNLGRQLVALGFDHLYPGYLGLNPIVRKTERALRRAATAASRLNLGQWAYITHHHPRNQDHNVRTPCLTDPAFQAKEKTKVQTYARVLKHYGVFYCLGDENALQTPRHDLCFSPTCQADLLAYLKHVYPSLDALNREWSTTFKTWDQVGPVDLAKARQAKQPARWVDHRLHMGRVWANTYRQSQQWIREKDPGALVGTDYFCPAHGDFGEVAIARTLTVTDLSPTEIGTEMIRSFDRPGLLKGRHVLWGFHERVRGPEGKKVWWALLDDAALCGMYAAEPGDSQSYIAADLRPYSYFRETLAEAEVIKGGVDKLVLPLRATAQVAAVFSAAAEHASTFHRLASRHRPAYFRLVGLLSDAGIYHHILPAEDLGTSGATGRYKVIYVPSCAALSATQCEALRQYVAHGGVLVADLRPATMNEHGRPLANGQLDALFGVTGASALPATTYSPVVGTWSGQTLELSDALVASKLKLTTGAAAGRAGRVPVMVSRAHGEGRAVLLNLSAELSFNGDDAAVGHRLLRALLSEAGGYLPVSAGRANHYQDGSAEHVVLVGSGARRIRFRQPGHLYDGRTAGYMGTGNEATVELVEHQGRWVSRLPYKVTGLVVTGPASVTQGTPWVAQVSVRTAGAAKPGRHVLAAKVFGPDGKERRHYRHKVADASGRANMPVPFCLNDTPGAWTVRISDVATGLGQSVAVRVEVHAEGSR